MDDSILEDRSVDESRLRVSNLKLTVGVKRGGSVSDGLGELGESFEEIRLEGNDLRLASFALGGASEGLGYVSDVGDVGEGGLAAADHGVQLAAALTANPCFMASRKIGAKFSARALPTPEMPATWALVVILFWTIAASWSFVKT